MEKLTKDEQQLLHSFRMLTEEAQFEIIGRTEERVLRTIIRKLPKEYDKQILELTRMLDKEDRQDILQYAIEGEKERKQFIIVK